MSRLTFAKATMDSLGFLAPSVLGFRSCSGPATSEMLIVHPAHCSELCRVSSQGSSWLELAVPQPSCLCPVFPSCSPRSKSEGMLPSLGDEGSSSVSIGKQINNGHLSPLLNSSEVLPRAGDGGSSALCPGPMLFLGSREGDRAVSWPTAHSHSSCCTQTQVGKACDQNGAKGSLKIKKKKNKPEALLEQKSEIE